MLFYVNLEFASAFDRCISEQIGNRNCYCYSNSEMHNPHNRERLHLNETERLIFQVRK